MCKRFWSDFCAFRGFSGMVKCCQSHFPPTNPRCHGNEIRDRIGYKSACEIFCICGGVFGNGPSNAANWISPLTKYAIPRLVQQISPRSLHLTEMRVESLVIRWRQSKSTSQPWFPGIMSSSVVGAAAVVDTSNVLYPTEGILLCLKRVKGEDTDPAIALFTCVRLIPRLLAIKQQI